MKNYFLALMAIALFPAIGSAFTDDTHHAKCTAEYLAKDHFLKGYINKVAQTGTLALKSWSFKSDERAFGPTIYVHMWHSIRNGKVVAQTCWRCYRNRIQDDDAYLDGVGFEYVTRGTIRCDQNPEYTGRD